MEMSECNEWLKFELNAVHCRSIEQRVRRDALFHDSPNNKTLTQYHLRTVHNQLPARHTQFGQTSSVRPPSLHCMRLNQIVNIHCTERAHLNCNWKSTRISFRIFQHKHQSTDGDFCWLRSESSITFLLSTCLTRPFSILCCCCFLCLFVRFGFKS